MATCGSLRIAGGPEVAIPAEQMVRVLENNLTFTKFVRRDFDDKYGIAGAKIGTVLNIRKPPRYIGRTGQGLALEDATETSVPLVLNTQRGVDIAFTSADMTLSIDDFSDRFLKPAIANIANQIDFDGLLQYQNVYNCVGAPGTVPNALLTYLQSGQRLDEEAAPRDNQRSLVISPAMQATIVDQLKGLFQSSSEISRQYQEGTMGQTIGYKWSMDQNVRTHVVGALGGTPAIASVPASGATTLSTSGWTVSVGAVKRGDVFTIGGGGSTPINAVNPQNKQNTGALRQFVVQADATADGSGNMTISILPAITSTGAFQTVTQLPVTGATNGALTFLGAANANSPQGLAFHKDAFAMGCADLIMPQMVDQAGRVADKQLGISIRMVRAYDINTDRFPTRTDVLYGWTTLYSELACRVAS